MSFSVHAATTGNPSSISSRPVTRYINSETELSFGCSNPAFDSSNPAFGSSGSGNIPPSPGRSVRAWLGEFGRRVLSSAQNSPTLQTLGGTARDAVKHVGGKLTENGQSAVNGAAQLGNQAADAVADKVTAAIQKSARRTTRTVVFEAVRVLKRTLSPSHAIDATLRLGRNAAFGTLVASGVYMGGEAAVNKAKLPEPAGQIGAASLAGIAGFESTRRLQKWTAPASKKSKA